MRSARRRGGDAYFNAYASRFRVGQNGKFGQGRNPGGERWSRRPHSSFPAVTQDSHDAPNSQDYRHSALKLAHFSPPVLSRGGTPPAKFSFEMQHIIFSVGYTTRRAVMGRLGITRFFQGPCRNFRPWNLEWVKMPGRRAWHRASGRHYCAK